jgi:spermidine synthase
MRRNPPPLLEVERPLADRQHLLRPIDPANICGRGLPPSVADRTYKKPFIVETGRTRSLHFDLASIQSAMRVDDPDGLCLAYTRKMMVFLLFNATPGRLLLLGLGGGSLAKFCFRRLQSSMITAVEINPYVLALRETFRVPPDDERFRVVQADAAQYVSRLARRKDVILADACDANGIAPQFDSVEFYHCVREALSDRGIFVSNLCGEVSCRVSHLAKIREVFGEPLLLPARRGHNLIVIACKESRARDCADNLEADALRLKARFGLEFPRFVRQIARGLPRREEHDVRG